ncbi:MAG: nuclear transport factor 2 family protein [Alphaproteobacteria bacterium]
MTPSAAFEAYCAAWVAGDHIAMTDLFTDDGVFEASTLDRPAKGREALLSQLRWIAQGQKNIRTETRTAIDVGDTAYIEGTYRGEIIGTGGKIDGSPHRVDFRFVAVVEMRDGKIARLAEIYDARPLFPEERQRMFTINRRTPYWQKTVEAGAMEWSVYNNMHFPMIYSHTPHEDYCALLEGVTLWDVALERQTQLKGPDAFAFLDYLCCRDMSTMAVGDCRYGLLSDEEGKLMCDPVVLRPWEDTIWLSHGNTDVTLWARGIVMGTDWDVDVSEPDVAPLQIQGPLALGTLEKVCDHPLAEMKNYTCAVTKVAGQDAVVSRTGWSGGFGFEVYPFSSDRAEELWDAILEAGHEFRIQVTGPIVHRAIERGVTDMNYYMNSDMNAFEDLGGKFVNVDTNVDFIGREALRKIRDAGIKRHSVGLLFEGDVPRIEWFWSLDDGNGHTGEVRWAIHSFELGQDIGIAVVDMAIAIGDIVEVTHPNGTTRAEVTTVPFVKRGA